VRIFRKKHTHTPPTEPPRESESDSSAHIPLLVEIAIEAWRVADRTRKLQLAANREDPAIAFSIDKIHLILREMGIEIKDPTGETYHEGMGFDVLTFDYGPSKSPANRVVQETVSPAIYYKKKLIKMAKVIIGSGGGQNSDAESHD
jgi:hypothetical protein